MLSKDQIKTAIFGNQLPTKMVKPFKGLNWVVSFHIVKDPLPYTLEEYVKLLSSALVIPGMSWEEKKTFLESISCFVVNVLFEKYIEFYSEWSKSLNSLVEDIVKHDIQSKFSWEISKHIGVDKILHSSEYNDAQLLWIFYNSIEEKKSENEYRNKLIENVFEMLKPWLDKELYVHMKETEESKRENVLFDEQTEQYLEKSSEGDKVEVEYR